MVDYLIGAVGDIPEGMGRAFQAGRRTVAVFKSKGKFFALSNRCAHRGASLCDGELSDNGTVVRCPWHNWPYDLATGEHRLDPKEKQRSFPVRVEGDRIIISI